MVTGRGWLSRVATRGLSSLEIGATAPAKSSRGKNLFELAALLPNGGIGTRFVRKSWLRNGYGDSHWTIKRIQFEPVREQAASRRAGAPCARHLTRAPAPPAPPRRAPQDGRHGDAWGTLTWKGEEKKELGRVRGTLKREWRYLPSAEPTGD